MRVKTLLMIPGINTNTSHSQTPITKMPPHPTVAQIRLNNISKCLAVTADTLEIIANSLKTPFLQAIVNTTQSLLENIQVNPFTECSASSSVFHCRQWSKIRIPVPSWWNKLMNCLMQLFWFISSQIQAVNSHPVCWNILGNSQSTWFIVYPSYDWPPLFRTLHKIHTFVDAQQSSSKMKRLFRQSEMSTLLKDCKNGLQQGFDLFQVR